MNLQGTSWLVLSRRSTIILLLLTALPIIANALALFGVVDPDAQLLFSGLEKNVVPGFLTGLPYIDPSGGALYEPAAREALRQWFAGEIPWWNHFAGMGMPLAGEVQPGVFSPYLLLLALPHGVILQQVVGQILCGLLTYKSLRLIGCSRSASLIGGALYELNGTFAWLGSIWSMPITALPLWIVGVEYARRMTHRGSWIGIAAIAAATYLAIVSSFIETGFLEGLFVIAWFVARFPTFKPREALYFTVVCAVGGVFGFLLAAPQIVALADALKYGFSIHQAGTIGFVSITTVGVPQMFLPYLWGPIFKYQIGEINAVWGNVGGYAGIGTALVACAAIDARKSKRLIVMLMCWIALTVGAEFGAPLMGPLINAIPGVKFTAQYRYSPPTWEFALVILCALLITEWQEGGLRFFRGAHRIALAAFAVMLSGFMYVHAATFDQLLLQRHYNWWLALSLLMAAVITVLVVSCIKRVGQGPLRILGIVLVGEAFLCYTLPTLYYPRSGSIDSAYVSTFHRIAGYSHLYSINALQPNFGSFYQIPLINHDDVIIPKNYVEFLPQLDPYNANALLFLPYRLGSSAGLPTLADSLAWHRQRFESIGVKYIDATSSQILPTFRPSIGAGLRPFALGRAHLSGQFAGMLHGDEIDAVGINVLAAGRPDGVIWAKFCSGFHCSFGEAVLKSPALEDQTLELKFDKPLSVGDGRVEFTIGQSGYHRGAQLWLYLRDTADETVVGEPGLFPRLELGTRLSTLVVPTGAFANQDLDLRRGSLDAALPAPKIDGAITSVAIFVGRPVGKMRLRLCSAVCVSGESVPRRIDPDGYVEIWLAKPLKIDTQSLKARFSAPDGRQSEPLALYAQAPEYPERISYDGKVMPGLGIEARFAIASTIPREVYRGSNTSLFELPNAKPYFSASHCVLTPSSRDSLVAHCSEGSTLVRRELYFPGWRATVNGTDAKISLYDEILEQVRLPEGVSIIRFRYEPRFASLALALSGLALVIVLLCGALALRSTNRSMSRSSI